MALNKQMEMFEDGGLRDQGDTIDPVSGNDVPSGSTQEEVRDDIPAQLSEGEFVLPADVVRYHGLEKIMALRDEAKAGLAKMEAMGQMGNSEEATLPDDMPFSMEDLDMEDDEPVAEQEGDSMEMAEGGYVMIAGKPTPIPRIGGQLPPITTRPNESTKNMAVGGFTNPTGTYQVPTNIATQPSYFQNYAQSTAPFSPFNPVETPIGTPLPTSTPVVGQTGQGPSFNTLMPQLTGKRETKEYRNAAGQKLFIPFINDEPIYPIPEGYTLFTAEAVTQKPIQTTTQSTSVRQDEGGSDDPLSGTTSVRGLDNSVVSTDFSNMNPTDIAKNMGNMSSTDRANAVQNAMQTSYGYTGFAKGMQQLGALAVPGVMASKMYGQKTMNPMDVLGQIGQPDMGARDAITNAFGYDEKGYDMDDPMDASLAGIDQQNAINTAIFGGLVTGKEGKTRGGIQGITVADIQKEYGIAPSYTSRGNKDVQIEIGTNPGQMSRGIFYDAGGRGNSLDAAYSGPTAALGYMSMAGALGYYGSPGMAREQAKQGNKKAQAVVNAMRDKDAFQAMEDDDRTDDEVSKDLGDVVSVDDKAAADKGKSIGLDAFGPTNNDDGTGVDNTDGGFGGADNTTDYGGTYKGSLITKRKASGKLKKKYMKRGGLASRK